MSVNYDITLPSLRKITKPKDSLELAGERRQADIAASE